MVTSKNKTGRYEYVDNTEYYSKYFVVARGEAGRGRSGPLKIQGKKKNKSRIRRHPSWHVFAYFAGMAWLATVGGCCFVGAGGRSCFSWRYTQEGR